MSMIARFAILLAAAAALASCGFRPLYAPAPDGAPAIGPVLVDEVPGKAGFALQAELNQAFGAERGQGAPRRLSIRLEESVVPLGLRVDESATRADVILSATYVFYEPDGTEAFRGASRATASYDIPVGSFGEIAAQDDARERAAETLAERIRAELAIRLAKRREQ